MMAGSKCWIDDGRWIMFNIIQSCMCYLYTFVTDWQFHSRSPFLCQYNRYNNSRFHPGQSRTKHVSSNNGYQHQRNSSGMSYNSVYVWVKVTEPLSSNNGYKHPRNFSGWPYNLYNLENECIKGTEPLCSKYKITNVK